MKVQFQDLEDRGNPRNGESFASASQVVGLLDELRCSRPPFMCELIGANGFTLTVGLGGDIGFVQHAPSDGTPPYLMAISSTEVEPDAGDMEFLVGGTTTPIDRRYRLSFDEIKAIVVEFVVSGNRSSKVKWEEF